MIPLWGVNNKKRMKMERTVFSAAQLEILDLMSYVESDDTLNEIKDMLSVYFARKAEIAIDKLWDSGKLNDQVIDQWKNEHMRIPYNGQR